MAVENGPYCLLNSGFGSANLQNIV